MEGLSKCRPRPPSKRVTAVFVHHEAAHYLVVYTMDRGRQPSRLRHNCFQGSTYQCACNHRLGVGAKGEIPMHLTTQAAPTAPSIHLQWSARWWWVHIAGRRLHVEKCQRLPTSVLLRHWDTHTTGRTCIPPQTRDCLGGFRPFLLGHARVSALRWIARPGVVCVTASGRLPAGARANGPRYAAAACRASAFLALRFPRLCLRPDSSCFTWAGCKWLEWSASGGQQPPTAATTGNPA